MTRLGPLAGAAAILVIAVGAIAIGLPRSLGITGGVTPTLVPPTATTSIPPQSPAASDSSLVQPIASPLPSPLDAADWQIYTSARYGFTVAYPPGWTVTPAAHQWALTEAQQWPNPGWDQFLSGDRTLGIGIFSLPVSPGTTVASWLASNCYSAPCAGFQDRAVNVTMAGHPALLIPFTDDFLVASVVDDRLYSIVAARPAQEYNSLQIVQSLLDTLQLPGPGSLVLDTSSWTPYTSAIYGTSTWHPADWLVTPATRPWSFASDNAGTLVDSAGADHFTSPDGHVRVSEWTIPTTTQVTDPIQSWLDLATWAVGYCRQIGGTGCESIPQQAAQLCNERRDCHPAFLVNQPDDVDAFWIGGGDPMTAMVLWRANADPTVAPYGGGDRLLEEFLSTAGVFAPSRPDVQPPASPTPSP